MSSSGSRRPSKMTDPVHEGITILWHISNYTPNYTIRYPTGPESLATQNSSLAHFNCNQHNKMSEFLQQCWMRFKAVYFSSRLHRTLQPPSPPSINASTYYKWSSPKYWLTFPNWISHLISIPHLNVWMVFVTCTKLPTDPFFFAMRIKFWLTQNGHTMTVVG